MHIFNQLTPDKKRIWFLDVSEILVLYKVVPTNKKNVERENDDKTICIKLDCFINQLILVRSTEPHTSWISSQACTWILGRHLDFPQSSECSGKTSGIVCSAVSSCLSCLSLNLFHHSSRGQYYPPKKTQHGFRCIVSQLCSITRYY